MQRYIVTSYIPSEDVGINEKFFASLKGFCKLNNASLIVLRTKANYVFEELDTRYNEYMVDDNIKLNDNLTLLNIAMNPNTSDPLSGLDSLCAQEGNLILGFPRQRFKTVPRSLKISSMPKAMWCTGTISKPNYKDSKTGQAMRQAHVYGALVVEIMDDKYFNIRQIQANNDGSFYDLDKLYKPDGKKEKSEYIEGLVLGDLHPPFLDAEVRDETYELIKKLKPKNIVYHDIFDANSISHHVEGKFITKSIIQKNLINLEHEAKITADCLADFERMAPRANHIIVKSNHDEHLDRYLDEFRFKTDYPNLIVALELARQMVLFKRKLDTVGPLEYLLKKFRDLNNFIFLERDSTYKIKGIECANHGDAGANGARGSSKSIGIMTSGNVVVGHRHSSEIGILGDYIVGTSTTLQMPYTDASGGSGWLNSHVVIYPSGARTHIHIIKRSK